MTQEQEKMEQMAQMEAEQPWMWDMPPGMPTATAVQKVQTPVMAEVPKEAEVTA